jgi:hypothetical protein
MSLNLILFLLQFKYRVDGYLYMIKRKISLKYFSIFVLAIILSHCEESEIIYEYPDGISRPAHITESRGCGNIFVYQFIDNLKALTVRINGDELGLTKKRQDFELNGSNPDLSVVLEIAGNDPDSIYFNFCNDVAYPNMGKTTKYNAVAGKLSYSVSEDNPIKEPIWKTFYYVTIRIEDLHLLNPETSDEIVINDIVFWNVEVGWLPG